MNDEHIILALETSGRSGSVAVMRVEADQLVCHLETLSTDSGSAKTLAPAVERLLTSNRIEMKELSAIALVTGPGSFTGLRVGVATAKAMAYALRIPTIEIDTLDTIALQCPVISPTVYAVLDAYRGQVFCAEYAVFAIDPAPQFERLSSTEIVNIEVLLDRVKQRGTDTVQTIDFCGPGCDRIRKYVSDPENGRSEITLLGERIHWIIGPATTPNAESVAKLGWPKLASGDVLDAFRIQPRYYRGSAAEEVAAKK